MLNWRRIIEFNDKYFPYWRKTEPIFYTNALAGEVGELCNLVKKLYGGGTNRRKVTSDDLAEEAVDVLIYLVLFLESIDIHEADFEHYFSSKMQTLVNRMENAKHAE